MNISRDLFIIFLYLFLDVVTVSLIFPWLPSLLEAFEQEQEWFYILCRRYIQQLGLILGVQENSLWDTVFLGGILSSSSSLAQFLSSPFAGALSDLFGRKSVLVVLQVFLLLVNILWLCFGKSFLWLLISRILCGAARANVGVISALVSDISSNALRTKGMAVVGLAYGIGFTVGPPCSVILLSRWNTSITPEHLSFVLGCTCVFINCINLLILLLILPTPLQKRGDFNQSLTQALHLVNPVKLFSFSGTTRNPRDDRSLHRLACFWFAYLCVFCGIEYTLIFLARVRFNFTSADQSKMFGFVGILMMVVQGGFIRRFRLGGEDNAITYGICSLILASSIFSLSTSLFMFYIGLASYAFASSIFFPSVNGLVSLYTTTEQQGHTLGIFRSLNALARVLGAAFVTIAFWIFGPSICYLICAFFLALLFIHKKTIWKIYPLSQEYTKLKK
ncbi:unnamed protein product [Trichobilharzia szidati]|nr:unnamed protein product [Trichobilharzia szidati]